VSWKVRPPRRSPPCFSRANECRGRKVLFAGRNVALVFRRGNIDPLILSRVIEKEMVADGRRCRFVAEISDRPGGLARLTRIIADAGASITDISHERAFSGPGRLQGGMWFAP
jgi:hypothetical protein